MPQDILLYKHEEGLLIAFQRSICPMLPFTGPALVGRVNPLPLTSGTIFFYHHL
jgi:hypothetical protein